MSSQVNLNALDYVYRQAFTQPATGALSSSSASLVLPNCRAKSMAVLPYLSLIVGSAPNSSRIRAVRLERPFRHAKCSAVSPSMFLALTSAPCSSRTGQHVVALHGRVSALPRRQCGGAGCRREGVNSLQQHNLGGNTYRRRRRCARDACVFVCVR